MLRQYKSNIWKQNETDKSKHDHLDEPILSIIVPFNNIGTKLAYQWKKILGCDKIFNNFKFITAYCNSQNLQQKFSICVFNSTRHNATQCANRH